MTKAMSRVIFLKECTFYIQKAAYPVMTRIGGFLITLLLDYSILLNFAHALQMFLAVGWHTV